MKKNELIGGTMSNKHYQPEFGENSQEVIAEDGKHKYWRVALPVPFYISGGPFWSQTKYGCGCRRQFKSNAEYELHYRKAYEEEKHMETEMTNYLKSKDKVEL